MWDCLISIYPFHVKIVVVTNCGRICFGHKKINLDTVFAGQAVAIKEVHDDIWLVSFMNYDLGHFRSRNSGTSKYGHRDKMFYEWNTEKFSNKFNGWRGG